jgi:hypothetical protein
MNKKIIFAISLVMIISFSVIIHGETIPIIGSSVNGIDYNFSSSQSHNYLTIGPYQSDLLMLRVTTPYESTCFFGKTNYSSISEVFKGEYGTKHDEILELEDLNEGVNKYYVICKNNSDNYGYVNEIVFSVNLPIEGNIKISEKDPPLKEGQYKITLTTSKICQDTLKLEYTLDEIVYKKISLKSSDDYFYGYLIIPEGIEETVGYFRLSCGGEETKITGDNLFIVDTIKPETIEIINAVGYQGQIKLNWFYDSELDKFNIYKSENPLVEYTDFYKTSSKNYFTDNDVEKGKTYYYRVAGIDEAGNIADLSKEVYATSLYSNSSFTSSGLDVKLIGKVDNLISEINALIKDTEDITSNLNSEEKEKSLFEDIKLSKEIEDSVLELSSIKRDAEKYKLQDLTEEELDKKINTFNLRINIIKKKIPENLVIINEKEISREINEENIQKAFLEYSENQEITDRKEIQNTISISNENKVKITERAYNVEVFYLDGTKKDITIIEDSLDSEIEILDGFFYIIAIPKDIAETVSELEIMNLNYEIIKEDPVLSFNSDTKRVVYYINKEIDLNSLENILVSPIQILNENSKVTGNVISNYISKDSIGLIILVVFVALLILYFLVLKGSSKNKIVEIIIADIKNIEKLIKENKKEEAKQAYSRLKEDYKQLSNKNKEKIVLEITNLNESLLK